MGFVKIDECILDSSLWEDFHGYRVFETGLLMCRPFVVTEPMPQYAVNDVLETGFIVPSGEYGFIAASGPGIIRKSLLPKEDGIAALERLGSPDPHSKDVDHEGRRMVRVDGGYIVLNYAKYRQKDHTAAERNKQLRERKKEEALRSVTRNERNETATVTQAEAEADPEEYKTDLIRSGSKERSRSRKTNIVPIASLIDGVQAGLTRQQESPSENMESGVNLIMNVTRDPPIMRDFWAQVLTLMAANHGRGALRKAVDHLKKKRLDSPAKYLYNRCKEHLEAMEVEMPKLPKSEKNSA